jgi:hypothetical protein
MPRAATTIDVFNAVAESKRRRVLGVLAGGERSVNDIVTTLKWPQPQVCVTTGGKGSIASMASDSSRSMIGS